ncbi:hypothetical protein MBLNU230_g3013t1 [Neophaeotheca triangularis]
MLSIRSAVLSAVLSISFVVAAPTTQPEQSPNEALVFRRQNDPNSVCSTFGVDIQDGGDYFVNTLDDSDFSSVSQFEGCNDDTANVLLINADTGDEYECDDLRTVPDDTSMISTCPISKSDITSGNYILLLLGNNGDGQPFAAQRDFVITAGEQETVWITPTTTLTITETPVTSVTSTSIIPTTESVNNTKTITKPAEVEYITITPPTATTTETKWLTHTRRRWSVDEDILTEVVTPSCTVPPPQHTADPPCLFEPTLIPMPRGIRIPGTHGKRPMDIAAVRQRFENHWRKHGKRSDNKKARHNNKKRDIDSATVTSTADTTANATSTVYAPTSTDLDITIVTTTITTTLPPKTISTGTKTSTEHAPTPYETKHRIRHTKTYVTKTFEVTRTETTTTTPGPDATACKRSGGHFGGGSRHWKWERPGKGRGRTNRWW